MERFVLDTSIFTNPDVYGQFGEEPAGAMHAFLGLAHRSGAKFYIPSSVYEELHLMREKTGVPPEFEAVVRVRSPRRFNITIPADILYEFIDEVRGRIDRGLRIAEEHAKRIRGGEDEDAGRVINSLRGRYREALRRGIIDSREDMDVLLLAYELDAVLLSADEGLRKWADKVGVMIVRPEHLLQVMEKLVEYQGPAGG